MILNFPDNSTYDNPSHYKFFESKARHVVYYGGAGAAKTYSVADKFALEIMRQKKPLNFVVVRKTLQSLKKTCERIINERFDFWGVGYSLNKQDMVASCSYGSKIYYVSMNNPGDYSKVQSLTDNDFIWIEEAHEITKNAWDILKLRLRGGKGLYSQTIRTFNPILITNWIYENDFVKNSDKSKKICVTISDNKYKDIEFEKELDSLQETNPDLYLVYRLGRWGRLSDTIYDNYEVVPNISELHKSYEIIMGIDFGFNNPSAACLIAMIDGKPFIIDEIYKTKMLNAELISEVEEMFTRWRLDKSNVTVYADTAEPDRIEDFHRHGFNIHPAVKDVLPGINFVKSLKIKVGDTCINTLKELQSYSWKQDKNGNKIDDPVKFNDHLMDALRYVALTHLFNRSSGSVFVASGEY